MVYIKFRGRFPCCDTHCILCSFCVTFRPDINLIYVTPIKRNKSNNLIDDGRDDMPCPHINLSLTYVPSSLFKLLLLPPTKEDVNAFARICLSVCLSVSKITQKRVHGFG